MATAKKTDPVAEAAPAVELTSAAEVRAVLERGLRTLRAFQDADRALAMLENLEQVAREREQPASAASARLAEIEQAVAAADEELKSSKAKARELVESANARAKKVTEDADARAKAMVIEAEERAAKLRTEADALVAQCLEKQAEIEALQPKADEARALIAKADAIRKAMQ